MVRKRNTVRGRFVIAAAMTLALAACAPSGSQSAGSTAVSLPTSTSALIDKSKQENGLIIYGNPPTDYLQPLFKAFNQQYPWIKVQDSDLDDAQIFSKFQSEKAQGARTADLLIDSSAKLFLSAVQNGLIVNTVPTGIENFPSDVKLAPGVYALSLEPSGIAYNKKLLAGKTVPTSWAQLAQLAKSDPRTYKLVTTDMTNSVAVTEYYGLQHVLGDRIWADFAAMAPATTTYRTGGDAVQQLSQGGAAIMFGAPGILQGILRQYASLMSFAFMSDGTPLVPRGVAMTAGTPSPASAQLFLNFLFTPAGQEALCTVGFEAGLNDFTSPSGCNNSLAQLQKTVDKSTVYTVPYNKTVVDDEQPFINRWNGIFK